jgi:DNA-binding FadR family transcriptional regulator
MERTDQTLSRLRELITADGIARNGRIPPERVLASELGIGRRSLRRALDVLEREGRIVRQQGRGTFIQTAERPGTGSSVPLDEILEHTNPLEAIEVRLSIEPVMARLAALRASQCDIKKLQRLAEETRSATDSTAYEEADEKFHRAVAEASRNALFLAMFDMLRSCRRDASWRRLGENAHCYKRQAVYADFHREICEAIATRYGERAHAAMYRHLSDVQSHIYRHAFPMGDKEQ